MLEKIDHELHKRLLLPDDSGRTEEFYVWDMALALHPDGSVVFLRHELQSASTFLSFKSQLEDHPPGTVELEDLTEVNGEDWIEYTDANGVLQFAHQYELHGASANEPAEPGGDRGINDPLAIDREGCKASIVVVCTTDGNRGCGSHFCRKVVWECACTNPLPHEGGPTSCFGRRLLNCTRGPDCEECNPHCHCISP
ncbi:MAG: hypothetical protein AAF533_07910 [Acidobacteriota bacterium]